MLSFPMDQAWLISKDPGQKDSPCLSYMTGWDDSNRKKLGCAFWCRRWVSVTQSQLEGDSLCHGMVPWEGPAEGVVSLENPLSCLRRKIASIWVLHGANPKLHYPRILFLGMQKDYISQLHLQLSWVPIPKFRAIKCWWDCFGTLPGLTTKSPAWLSTISLLPGWPWRPRLNMAEP